MATLYKLNGEIVEVKPKKDFFSYKELQEYIAIGEEKMVEMVDLPSGKIMIVNENGKLLEPLLINEEATKLWKKEYPISEYSNNNDELIVGQALVVDSREIE